MWWIEGSNLIFLELGTLTDMSNLKLTSTKFEIWLFFGEMSNLTPPAVMSNDTSNLICLSDTIKRFYYYYYYLLCWLRSCGFGVSLKMLLVIFNVVQSLCFFCSNQNYSHRCTRDHQFEFFVANLKLDVIPNFSLSRTLISPKSCLSFYSKKNIT
jgi:hypothetical protein